MINVASFLEKLLIGVLTIGIIYFLTIAGTSALDLADMMEAM